LSAGQRLVNGRRQVCRVVHEALKRGVGETPAGRWNEEALHVDAPEIGPKFQRVAAFRVRKILLKLVGVAEPEGWQVDRKPIAVRETAALNPVKPSSEISIEGISWEVVF